MSLNLVVPFLEACSLDLEINFGARIFLIHLVSGIETYIENRTKYSSEKTTNAELLILHAICKLSYYAFTKVNHYTISETYRRCVRRYAQKLELNIQRNITDAKMLQLLHSVNETFVESADRYVEVHQSLAFSTTNLLMFFESCPEPDPMLLLMVSSTIFRYLFKSNDDVIMNTVVLKNKLSVGLAGGLINDNYEAFAEADVLATFADDLIRKFDDNIADSQNKVNDFDWSAGLTRVLEDVLSFNFSRSEHGSSALLRDAIEDATFVIVRLAKFNNVSKAYQLLRTKMDDAELSVEPEEKEKGEQLDISQTFVTVDDLQIKRNGKLIMNKARFTIPSGTTILIDGASGVGKTHFVVSTILKGHRSRDCEYSGDVYYGNDRVGLSDIGNLNGIICNIRTTERIVAGLTIQENLTLGVEMTAAKSKLLQQLLVDFELETLREKTDLLASSCSTGEQQRIQLIWMILHDRPVWLLDEALSNIDKRMAKRCLSVIQSIQKEKGKTVFMITHASLSATPDITLKVENKPGDYVDIYDPIQWVPAKPPGKPAQGKPAPGKPAQGKPAPGKPPSGGGRR